MLDQELLKLTTYIKLDAIADQLGPVAVPEVRTGKLAVPQAPDPFVPPSFSVRDGDLAQAEVLTVSAPAAVGKSVTARHLAAETGAPLLDLSAVHVGAGSLAGLLDEYSPDAIGAFHRGELPVIVDAIDEGSLLSGIQGIEAFIETAAQFISRGHSVPGRVKVVILGRDDSVRYRSNLVMELTSDLSVCAVHLDFFERDGALELIPMYAERELARLRAERKIDDNALERRRAALEGEPMRQLIQAHFSPIEHALGISSGQLWNDEKGRAFVGYAPVLSSIGILLANVDNPRKAESRLKKTGTDEAWRVIVTVMDDVLEREQGKLKGRLDEGTVTAGDPYSTDEQLQYLTDRFHGRSLEVVKSLEFRDAAAAADYETKVQQINGEHPFVKGSGMANDVLGSRVFAWAVVNDRIGPDLRELKAISRQPFLWRFVRREIYQIGEEESADPVLIDGRYLGCILASYWNDPAEPDGRSVFAKDIAGGNADEGFVQVAISADANQEVSFKVMPPILLYSRLQDCMVETGAEVTIEGAVARREDTTEGIGAHAASNFTFRGEVSVITGQLTYSCDTATLEGRDGHPGSLWLEASDVEVIAAQSSMDIKDNSKYGWGNNVGDFRPWSLCKESTLTGPSETSILVNLIYDCRARLGRRIVFRGGFEIERDNPALAWIIREYDAELFGKFLRRLVDSNLVNAGPIDAAGGKRLYAINFGELFWPKLIDAVRRLRRGERVCDDRFKKFLDLCKEDGLSLS